MVADSWLVEKNFVITEKNVIFVRLNGQLSPGVAADACESNHYLAKNKQ